MNTLSKGKLLFSKCASLEMGVYPVLDYNLPPNARFVLLCPIVTPLYLARRRLSQLLPGKNRSNSGDYATRRYSLLQNCEVFSI